MAAWNMNQGLAVQAARLQPIWIDRRVKDPHCIEKAVAIHAHRRGIALGGNQEHRVLSGGHELEDGWVARSQKPQVQELTLTVDRKLQDQFTGTSPIVCNEPKVHMVSARGGDRYAVCDGPVQINRAAAVEGFRQAGMLDEGNGRVPPGSVCTPGFRSEQIVFRARRSAHPGAGKDGTDPVAADNPVALHTDRGRVREQQLQMEGRIGVVDKDVVAFDSVVVR